MAGIKKLRADAKAHLTNLVARRKERANTIHNDIARVSLETHEKLLADSALWEKSLLDPILIPYCIGVWTGKWHTSQQYLYQDAYWDTDNTYTHEQLSLLIKDACDNERRKFERLKQKFSGIGDTKTSRPTIPEAVRVEVWRRDQGTCVKCTSRARLEYDHIIPIAEGGSNTARNIELLCEDCNRKKGALIQ